MGTKRCVAKRAATNKEDADQHLQTEAYLDAKLCDAVPGSRHLAPLLGVCTIAGSRHLVWEACPGVHDNLLAYLEPKLRLPELARDLGIVHDCKTLTAAEESALARKLMREMLSALSLLHREGVVHRDVIRPCSL